MLTPVVDLVVDKTITTKTRRSKENGATAEGDDDVVEEKKNVFTRHLEDPDFVHLCYEILARNAPMMRLVVITNFQKMQQVIRDYLAAQNNETQHSHRLGLESRSDFFLLDGMVFAFGVGGENRDLRTLMLLSSSSSK